MNLKLRAWVISESLQPLFFSGFSCEFDSRVAFEKDGLAAALERLATLETVLSTEEANLANYEGQKMALRDEIAASEEAIEDLRKGLAEIQETFEEKTKNVEAVKNDAIDALLKMPMTLSQRIFRDHLINSENKRFLISSSFLLSIGGIGEGTTPVPR